MAKATQTFYHSYSDSGLLCFENSAAAGFDSNCPASAADFAAGFVGFVGFADRFSFADYFCPAVANLRPADFDPVRRFDSSFAAAAAKVSAEESVALWGAFSVVRSFSLLSRGGLQPLCYLGSASEPVRSAASRSPNRAVHLWSFFEDRHVPRGSCLDYNGCSPATSANDLPTLD